MGRFWADQVVPLWTSRSTIRRHLWIGSYPSWRWTRPLRRDELMIWVQQPPTMWIMWGSLGGKLVYTRLTRLYDRGACGEIVLWTNLQLQGIQIPPQKKNIYNFISSDPHPHAIFWHSFWYIYIYTYGIYTDILFDILSRILFDIYSYVLSGILSGIILNYILFGIPFGILSGIYSDILSFILSAIRSDILSGIYSVIRSDILLAFYLASILTFYLASILTFFLPFDLAFCRGPLHPDFVRQSLGLGVPSLPQSSRARQTARIRSCAQSRRAGREGAEEEVESKKVMKVKVRRRKELHLW